MTEQLFIILLTIIFIVYGLGMIVGGPSLAFRWYYSVYQVVVLNPLRWGWRQIRRGTWWLTRWGDRQLRRGFRWTWRGSVRQIRRFLTYLRGQIAQGARSIWTRLPWNGRVMAGIALALVILIPLVILFNRMAGGVINWLTSIPLYYVYWGLGILGIGAVLALLVWLFRSGGVGYAGRTMRSGWLWQLVTLLVVIAIGIGAWRYFSSRSTVPTNASTATATPVVASVSQLPADIVLPIIAECESGGRQFDSDGKVITSPTEDVGKWQINIPLHGDEAKKLNIDLMTESGNEEFARLLYARNELGDWEASKACWEPQLLALGGHLPATETTFMVIAKKEWTGMYHFPPAMTVDLRGLSKDSRFAIKIQSGSTYNFTPEKSDVVPGAIASASFMALGESPENIRVRLYR